MPHGKSTAFEADSKADDAELRQHPSTSRNDLRAFCAVYDQGSYRKAAAALGTSYNTVWRQMSRLSQRLGSDPKRPVLLFESIEGEDNVRPTAAAHALIGPCRSLVAAELGFAKTVELARDDKVGTILLGCYPAHVQRFVARAIAMLKEQCPEVRVRIERLGDERRGGQGEELIRDVGQNKIDFAVAPGRPVVPTSLLRSRHLYRWRLVAIRTDECDDADAVYGPPIGIRELRDERLLLSPPGFRSRAMVEQAARDAGFDVEVANESPNVEALLELGFWKLGVPVMPSDAVRRVPISHPSAPKRHRHLARVRDVTDAYLQGDYHLFWRREATSGSGSRGEARGSLVEARRVFMECLVQCAAEVDDASETSE